MVWRKPGEKFDFSFSGRGSQKGTGEKVAHFMIGIVYRECVIAARQYSKINPEKLS